MNNEHRRYWTTAEWSAWANRDARARARQAAEIKRLRALRPTGKLTNRRLRIEVQHIISRVAEVVRWFWHGGSPTAPAV